MSKRPDPGAFRPPRVRWIERRSANLDGDGDDALFLSGGYGLVADEWQEPIIRDWMRKRRNGKWACRRCGISVPRQNGKNAVIEIRELFGMVELGEKFLHTAHEVKTARKAFKRLLHFFGDCVNDPAAKFPELNALVTEIRKTNGQEAIVLSNGGSIEFVARSKGSGRGFTVDVLVLDECQALTDEQLEALRPAISSAPLGNPQIIYAGTPPNRDKDESGEVWLRVRRGAGTAKDLSWTEYGVPDGPLPDIEDPRLLFDTNPSLEVRHANGAYGLQMDVVEGERADLSKAGYARERLGWYGDPNTKHQGVINMQVWASLKVKVPPPSRAAVVVDVSPDLEWTSIGAAAGGRNVDETLVLLYHEPGTDWPVEKLRDLRQTIDVVELALTKTAAAVLGSDLTKAGIPWGKTTPQDRAAPKHDPRVALNDTEVGAGCSWFQQKIKDGGVVHVGQAELDAAVRNARTRFVGKVQHWEHRDPRIVMSPLVAVSVAAQRWEAFNAAPKTPAPPPRRAQAPARRGGMDSVGF